MDKFARETFFRTIRIKINRGNEHASTLLVALLVILVIAGFTGIAVSLTSNTIRQTDSSRDYSALKSSAEGALDFAYGVWSKTTNSFYRPVTKAQVTAKLSTVPSLQD